MARIVQKPLAPFMRELQGFLEARNLSLDSLSEIRVTDNSTGESCFLQTTLRP